ncbi:hypothetical protein WDV06_27240 [Streptomyces racemochromogenes]|uniref:Uncharacterized protein n=1 Tax=Streptomyces racemochromogenes TaxID=67353 RepID=A0ABW7PLC2_9ACTN
MAAGVVQTVFPSVIDAPARRPQGERWRAVRFGTRRMLPVFAASGVTAQAVSTAGWSVRGGGDSVAICGLVGALAARYAVRGGAAPLRRGALLVPAAGLVLCLPADHHGAGLVVGCGAGLGLALRGPAREAGTSTEPGAA